jgi:mono/diheme cytochrome c family protein
MPAIEPDPQRPDLDDAINVSEAHERLLREAAAVAREKHLPAPGSVPLPMSLVVAVGVVLVIAGGVLGAGGRLFDYGKLQRPGYVRAVPEDGGATGPQPMPALQAFVRRGQKIYTRCTGCHGADGKGGPAYPSLVGSAWATGETQRFAMIILNGLEGPTSTGKAYPAPMAPQGGGMTAEDLASVMTYVRNSFGNEVGDVVSIEQARNAMEISAARARAPQMVNKEELDAEHVKELEGATMAADTLVDPVSLEPIEPIEQAG